MKYEAVIFDCDGVLVDSESISNRYLVEMAQEEGIDIDLSYSLQNFQGHALAHVFQEMEKLKGHPLKANFEEDFRQRTFKAFAEEIEAVDGAHDLIETLDCPMAVASNGPRHKMDITLKGAGLYSFFEGRIFSAYEINSWKPNPELFLYAAQKINANPANTIVIEDSMAGVKAALKGGFKVYALAREHTRNQLEQSEATLIGHLSEIKQIKNLL